MGDGSNCANDIAPIHADNQGQSVFIARGSVS